jgi:hypothetical protein
MNRRRKQVGGGRLVVALITLGLLAPAGALAAPAKPGVANGAAANVAQTTATVTGKVNPNEAATTYFFEYGPTQLYGSRTGDAPAGNGNSNVNVAADLGGLAPATRYHYRLVAFNSRGVTRSGDRTFTTKRQPLGLSLAAAPNPIRPNGRSVLFGTLSGTGNGDRRIQLQSNPFPYTQGFQNTGDTHLTNADGSFGFPLFPIPVNTQYRVVLPNVPEVVSPIVTVGVRAKVSIAAKRVKRLARGATFRLSGKVRPARDGQAAAIQRLRKGVWVTVASTTLRAAKGDASKYRKTLRVRRSGTFRVSAGTNNGANDEAVSRAVRLRVG